MDLINLLQSKFLFEMVIFEVVKIQTMKIDIPTDERVA